MVWPTGTEFVVRTSEGLDYFLLVNDAPDAPGGRILHSSHIGEFLTSAVPGAFLSHEGETSSDSFVSVELIAIPGKPPDFTPRLLKLTENSGTAQHMSREERRWWAIHRPFALANALRECEDARRFAELLEHEEDETLHPSSDELKWIRARSNEIFAFVFKARYTWTRDLAYLARACSYSRKAGNPPRVIRWTHNISRSSGDPKKVAMVLTSRGGAFNDLGDLLSAATVGRLALELAPGNWQTHNLLGSIARKSHSDVEAEEHFRRVEELKHNKVRRDVSEEPPEGFLDHLKRPALTRIQGERVPPCSDEMDCLLAIWIAQAQLEYP